MFITGMGYSNSLVSILLFAYNYIFLIFHVSRSYDLLISNICMDSVIKIIIIFVHDKRHITKIVLVTRAIQLIPIGIDGRNGNRFD